MPCRERKPRVDRLIEESQLQVASCRRMIERSLVRADTS